MTPITPTEYYQKNDIIYQKGIDEFEQDRTRKAYIFAKQILKENKSAVRKAKNGSSGCSLSIKDPTRDVWFWLYMSNLSHPYHHTGGGGGCGSCGSCGGGCSGGGDGKAEAIAALIALLIALVVGGTIAIGITGYQGYEAEKIRKKINEIKKANQAEKDEKINAVFEKTSSILKGKWQDAAAQTCFTATIAAGLCFLTAATSVALYALQYNQPIHSLAKALAWTGIGVLGTGIAAYAIRPIVRSANERKFLEKIRALEEALSEINCPPSPFDVLKTTKAPYAFIKIQDVYYIKQGDKYVTASSVTEKFIEVKLNSES